MSSNSILLTNDVALALSELMRIRHIETEAGAIRAAVQEALDRERIRSGRADFARWIGLANQAPANVSPRFHSDDDLWR